MSMASAAGFLARMRDDEEFRQRIQAIGNETFRREAIRAAGFDFTPEELQAALNRAREELEDEELGLVAGGLSDPFAALLFGDPENPEVL